MAPPIARALQAPVELARYALPQWDELLRQARRTNLVGRLAYELREAGTLRDVPAAPRAHLESALVVAEAQIEAVRREVGYLSAALAGLGVDIVLLKGAAYSVAGLPAARGRLFSDIDILLPFDRLAEAEAALNLHGWSTTHHHAYDQRYYREWMHELPPLKHNVRGSVLDVHHAILPRTARHTPDSAKLLAASVAIAGTSRLRVLCPTDMVLHGATHLVQNEELSNGLRDLCDLDSLLRHFGRESGFWDALAQRAGELGLVRQAYYGLHYASRSFGTPVPASVWKVLSPGRPRRLLGRFMDGLYDHALLPVGVGDAELATSLSRFALYLRAHWLRMPPYLLVAHLAAKAVRRRSPAPRPG